MCVHFWFLACFTLSIYNLNHSKHLVSKKNVIPSTKWDVFIYRFLFENAKKKNNNNTDTNDDKHHDLSFVCAKHKLMTCSFETVHDNKQNSSSYRKDIRFYQKFPANDIVRRRKKKLALSRRCFIYFFFFTWSTSKERIHLIKIKINKKLSIFDEMLIDTVKFYIFLGFFSFLSILFRSSYLSSDRSKWANGFCHAN